MNPAAATTIRAARAAKAQREANQPKPREAAVAPRLRTGRRTAQAIAALRNLRNDLALGMPPAALIERIDDELFKLTKGRTK